MRIVGICREYRENVTIVAVARFVSILQIASLTTIVDILMPRMLLVLN